MSALWFMVLLSSVGLEVALQARIWRRTVLVRVERAQSDQLAHALVERAKVLLAERARLAADPATSPLDDPWQRRTPALGDTVCLAGRCGRLDARDAGARLHLHQASAEDLERLFVALRVDAGRAAQLAAAIVDWQDGDDLRRVRGAEREEYRRGITRVFPSNAPFANTDDLIDVFGMDRAILERTRPFVTVVGRGAINVNTAPREVLLSIEGIGPELAAQIELLQRAGITVRSAEHLMELLPRHLREGLVARRGLWERKVTYRVETLEYETVVLGADSEWRGSERGAMHLIGEAVLTSPGRAP